MSRCDSVCTLRRRLDHVAVAVEVRTRARRDSSDQRAARSARRASAPQPPRGRRPAARPTAPRRGSAPAKIAVDLVVVQPLVGADQRAVERGARRPSARAAPARRSPRGGLTPGTQRAGVVGQRLREHRLDGAGDVDARRAAVRLAVDRRARAHERADVGDVDPDAPTAVGQRLAGDRVVEVLRRGRVDRERRQVAQVAALGAASPRRSPARASSAARSTAGGEAPRRPRSSISASITSRATSGRPEHAQRPLPRVRGPRGRTSTRSPGRASRSRSTVQPRGHVRRTARRPGSARAGPARPTTRRGRRSCRDLRRPAPAARRRSASSRGVLGSSRRRTSGVMPAPVLDAAPAEVAPAGREVLRRR